MPTAPVNGIEIYYEVHGRGPAVVFAHGAAGNHLSWWQQIPAFAKSYRCIIFDHRGFGFSRDTDGGPGPKAFVDDLEGLLQHLDIAEVRLVGQSMGGLCCLGYALRHPERVKALVMADTIVGMRRQVWLAADEEKRQQAQAIWRQRREKGPKRALGRRFIRQQPELAFLYREMAALNPARPEDFVRQYADTGATAERLAELAVPVLFIVGEEDDLIPPSLVAVAQELLPNSRLVVVPGAGHSVYFEQPQTFNEIVQGFFADVA